MMLVVVAKDKEKEKEQVEMMKPTGVHLSRS